MDHNCCKYCQTFYSIFARNKLPRRKQRDIGIVIKYFRPKMGGELTQKEIKIGFVYEKTIFFNIWCVLKVNLLQNQICQDIFLPFVDGDA